MSKAGRVPFIGHTTTSLRGSATKFLRVIADFAPDLFGTNLPCVPALKIVDRWYGDNYTALQEMFLANTGAPSHRDPIGYNVSYSVSLAAHLNHILIAYHDSQLSQGVVTAYFACQVGDGHGPKQSS